MSQVIETNVVIVGAGPSGLALAAELHRRCVRPLLDDQQPAGANTSRAAVVHARTLEVLAPLGVSAALLEQGVKVPIFRVRDRDHALLEIDFSHIPSAYPFTLMCPQDRTERALLSCLEALGGEVQRPCTLLGFEQRADHVELELAMPKGTQRVRCQWLIGCDGMHSRVREQAAIAFTGAAYEQTFVLADVHMRWPLARDEVSLFLAGEGLVVVAPLPEQRFRIVATADEAPQQPTAPFVQALIDRRGPAQGACQIEELVWSSRFRVHHRLAASPRKGRVLLCGDAAHVHSPAGGQGMNTGIQDGVSLAAALAATLGDAATERL